jgi:signal transduction histidine kinase
MPQASDPDENARLLTAGRLVRAVTHNLRQPLMALEMNLATILKLTKREPIDAASVADAIEDARLAGRRMAMSLKALEELTVPRRRRDETLDVGQIAREIATLVGTNSVSSGVRVEAHVEAGLPQIVGDSAMVRETILALTLSAVDHMLLPPDGGASAAATRSARRRQPPITITARRADEGHVAVIVEHARTRPAPTHADDEARWDTTLANVATGLHGGSVAVEVSATTHRVTTRWPVPPRAAT